jgi:hypothetical protein
MMEMEEKTFWRVIRDGDGGRIGNLGRVPSTDPRIIPCTHGLRSHSILPA